MNYVHVVVSDSPSYSEVHICEVGAENKPSWIVRVLTDVEAKKYLYQLNREFEIEAKAARRELGLE